MYLCVSLKCYIQNNKKWLHDDSGCVENVSCIRTNWKVRKTLNTFSTNYKYKFYNHSENIEPSNFSVYVTCLCRSYWNIQNNDWPTTTHHRNNLNRNKRFGRTFPCFKDAQRSSGLFSQHKGSRPAKNVGGGGSQKTAIRSNNFRRAV